MDDLHDLPTPQSKPRKPLPLIVLAVAIALAGLGAAWWFAQSQKPPAAHPEAERFRRIEALSRPQA